MATFVPPPPCRRHLRDIHHQTVQLNQRPNGFSANPTVTAGSNAQWKTQEATGDAATSPEFIDGMWENLRKYEWLWMKQSENVCTRFIFWHFERVNYWYSLGRVKIDTQTQRKYDVKHLKRTCLVTERCWDNPQVRTQEEEEEEKEEEEEEEKKKKKKKRRTPTPQPPPPPPAATTTAAVAAKGLGKSW